MKPQKRIIMLIGAIAASKHAVAASATTAITAAMISNNWVTWAISGAGAVAYRLKTPETRKTVAVGNGIISVFLGGLGAPWLFSVIFPNVAQPPVLLASFLVALLWPYYWDKFSNIKKDQP